jgi:hypothetical protein
MAKEKPNKWTRERTFLEEHGGDILVWGVSLFFLILMVGGLYVAIFQPHIRGLSEAFSAPPVRYAPPADQKLHLAPGETEMRLYPVTPAKPAAPPEQGK